VLTQSFWHVKLTMWLKLPSVAETSLDFFSVRNIIQAYFQWRGMHT